MQRITDMVQRVRSCGPPQQNVGFAISGKIQIFIMQMQVANDPTTMRGTEKKRQGGGIEPLHVSMPRELKSRPSTSPTHPGILADLRGISLALRN